MSVTYISKDGPAKTPPNVSDIEKQYTCAMVGSPVYSACLARLLGSRFEILIIANTFEYNEVWLLGSGKVPDQMLPGSRSGPLCRRAEEGYPELGVANQE